MLRLPRGDREPPAFRVRTSFRTLEMALGWMEKCNTPPLRNNGRRMTASTTSFPVSSGVEKTKRGA